VRGWGLESGKRSVVAPGLSPLPKLGEERVESPIVPPGVAMPLRSLGTEPGALGLKVSPPPGVEPSPDDSGFALAAPLAPAAEPVPAAELVDPPVCAKAIDAANADAIATAVMRMENDFISWFLGG
jgi:hypothetical protein